VQAIREEVMEAAEKKILTMPHSTQILACSKCGRDCVVSTRTFLVFCRDCSAGLGVKK